MLTGVNSQSFGSSAFHYDLAQVMIGRFLSRLRKTVIPAVATNRRQWLSFAFLVVIVLATIALNSESLQEIPVNRRATPVDKEAILQADSLSHHLNQQYLAHMAIYNKRRPPRQQALLDSTSSDEEPRPSTTIVIGRLKNETERVQWVYDKLEQIDNRYIVIVDDNTTDLPHLDQNHGREAAVYLDYIVKHYDALDDITFFWHNDEVVWHNNMLLGWNSAETLNRMNLQAAMTRGYTPSRCDHWPGCPAWIQFDPSPAEHRIDPHRLGEMFTPALFQRLFPDVQDFPPYFAGTCCSQFAVTRDAIRSRPLSTYQALLDWVTEYEFDQRSGMVFEYVWPFIFTGKGTVCPSMEHCYGSTYDIYLEPEDMHNLEDWNGYRTRREEIKWQAEFMEEALEIRQREAEREGASEEEVLALETKFEPEIKRMNDMLYTLENTTWHLRERIIHKFKLPVPPTGW